MRIYRHFDAIAPEHKGGVIAIGNFDGVHRGHRAVIGEAGRIAKATGAPWGVLTFEPHPRTLFAPDTPPFRLTPFHLKSRLIEEMGVDFLIVLQFDLDFSRRSAESFVADVLIGNLNARHIVSGFDFVFGHQRQGTAQFLEARGKAQGNNQGFGTTSVGAITDETGEVVSSTRIRTHLAEGRPRDAARLLGRSFEIEGRVSGGDQRGRTIGFPTANLMLGGTQPPLFGVYAIRAGIETNEATVWHDGVANLGYRPTFGGTTPVLETHIFDFADDIYGKHLRVALVEFLRPERKFDGITALTEQIKKDSNQARALLAKEAK
jgi:riboflavin kinase/FMN adenylyltransferase